LKTAVAIIRIVNARTANAATTANAHPANRVHVVVTVTRLNPNISYSSKNEKADCYCMQSALLLFITIIISYLSKTIFSLLNIFASMPVKIKANITFVKAVTVILTTDISPLNIEVRL